MNTTTAAHATPAGGLTPELKWTLTKIHATTLLLAWFFLVPLSASLARFLRRFAAVRPEGVAPVRPSLWFHAHRAINLMALSLMFLGLLTILVAHEWRWLGPTIGGTRNSSSSAWHTLFGVLAIALAAAQPLNAVLRCRPGHARRPVFNLLHRCAGVAAWLLAAVCIFIACVYFGKRFTSPSMAVAFCISIVGFVVVAAFGLDFVHLLPRFRPGAERDEEKRGFPDTDYFLLAISIFVLAALCFCLCCLVWLKAPA
ncbi:Ferric-chelate reductase 1 [Aphelenchoides fujianensis]|nr:Ferric-chelate reductase 1 [Aphelenchoides fujianensis]